MVRPAAAATVPNEPLREKRKRELRQQLSDVATRLFLQHGFDEVRVADVAKACGVTEKTVYNYFPSKESLLADRWEVQTETLYRLLCDRATDPIDAALEVLQGELAYMTSGITRTGSRRRLKDLRTFSELIQSTPALRSHNREALDRLSSMAAIALAERTGTAMQDPEPWITATAITGLWSVYFRSLRWHLGLADPSQVPRAVQLDLDTAAGILRRGI
jgi:AcrR family transcriptional regulator